MNFQALAIAEGGVGAVAADALIVVLPADGKGGSGDKALDGLLATAVKQGDFERKAGRTLYLHGVPGLKAQRVVLAGARDASAKAFRAAVAAGLAALKGRAVKHLAVNLSGETLADTHAEALVLALEQAAYSYTATKPSAEAVAAPAKVSLLADKAQLPALKAGLARGEGIAAGIGLAKACANLPANICTPTYLGEEAKRLGREHGLKVQVLDQKAVEKLGMGSFLSVSRGSQEPLRFIVMEYNGAAKKDAPIVLVGKGITFDTGGISLKPAADMDEMKFDMCGAASVLGTMRAVAELKPRINVVALIPTCENMPSGLATKPGDVVTSMSGQTIEILNTDAEGRLILCDALTYAERFKPAAVVDIATLTGACVVALGHHNAGLFASDEALAADLLAASVTAQDPAWRLPLDDEYDEGLKSNFADMANVGSRAGGAITAAKFLQRYTAKYPWAHLDIAGVAHRSGAAKGATGRPVGLLTHFVLARAAKA
ncbi:MAG TPA: leucyl aminopeptidase [Ideonella sp.]|uniref:leucyl aminopeptidase n=1 Tax=Ideonella sp. TaxID=1929293 RepID=UPI002C4A3BD3|nr:leucyl aminopeptidase [Ideonella sp.]HSI50952.1 leucyl aminopeptidase [Ideonella sp.]